MPPFRPQKCDWSCSCGEMNFASRASCRSCKKKNPSVRDGDWVCKFCDKVNFASRVSCFSCKKIRLEVFTGGAAEADWKCAVCLFSNFGTRSECLRCHLPKGCPADCVPNLRDGEWQCTCRNVNKGAAVKCLECGFDRPRSEAEKEVLVKMTGECIVCMDTPASTILMPCGHLAVCETCSAALDKCPSCRAEIAFRTRVFIDGLKG